MSQVYRTQDLKTNSQDIDRQDKARALEGTRVERPFHRHPSRKVHGPTSDLTLSPILLPRTSSYMPSRSGCLCSNREEFVLLTSQISSRIESVGVPHSTRATALPHKRSSEHLLVSQKYGRPTRAVLLSFSSYLLSPCHSSVRLPDALSKTSHTDSSEVCDPASWNDLTPPQSLQV